MKNLILGLLLSCSFTLMHAQAVTVKTAKKKALTLYEQADYAGVMGKYDALEQLMLECVNVEPDFINAHLQLGDLYFMYHRNYSKASYHYNRVISLDRSFAHDVFLKLGLAYYFTDEFDSAKSVLKEYLTKSKIEPLDRYRAELYIRNCDFVPNARQNPVPADIQNLGPGVNSKFSEYFPALTADEKYIYYTVSAMEGRHTQEDIYFSKKIDGQWSERQKIEGNINTKFANEGAHCISPDGLYLLFTACNWPEGVGGCDLYVSRKEGNEWKKPINMGLNINSKSKDTQPSISADGMSIYYVSNRSGGSGGQDIYVSKLDSTGRYGKPENLGPVINTPMEEERPFIHPDGRTLFFASEGHPGMGEFDIYMSRINDQGEWSEPVNLGYPINTKNDEMGIYTSTDGKSAFYASKRDDSRGEIDIYQVALPDHVKPLPTTYIEGTVSDKESGEPLTATVEVTDVANGEIASLAYSDKVTGEFLVTIPTGKQYAYSVQKTGYLFYSESFSLVDHHPEEPYHLDIKLERIRKGNKVVLKNIFFETAKYDLKKESDVEVRKVANLLVRNPELKIEIGGHTDDVGSKTDNQLLSENRAKAVYSALIEKGISKDRLRYKGYGMTQPIVPNDSDQNRAQNRRTEFKVID